MRGAAAKLPLASLALLLCRSAHAAPSVWVIDDGEKIRRDATSTPFERGEQNPVWRPGAPVHLFALPNESIALQVVVEADSDALSAVSVDLPEIDGPSGAKITTPAALRPPASALGRAIERFVEHFVEVRRPSGGRTAGESLGWESGAGPDPNAWVGPVPDALVPVELEAPWIPYPMRIAAKTNGVVWIDVNVPSDQRPGTYRGTIDVRNAGHSLASIPVELEVAAGHLPDRTAGAMLYYDPDEISRRVGSDAEPQLWKLLHAHRIAALHDATEPDDVRRQRDALDGSLYGPNRGYYGSGRGLGDGVLSLGAYGGLGDANLAKLTALADTIAQLWLFEGTDVFLYADDENCASARGASWRELVKSAVDPNVRRVRVGWTCSRDAETQPVDIPIVSTPDYDAEKALHARARGKEVWVYNGVMPHAGTLLLDADAVSPRVNGWLGEMFDIPRWFYWSSTYWYERHGKIPTDPFSDPESFHNDDGDWANGDGMLLYPGRQVDRFAEHSLGFEGVLPSIRLKNWRRGIEDAGYLALARARDPQRADAVARSLIPRAFSDAPKDRPASWSPRGQDFFEARRALLAIALGPAARAPSPSPEPLPPAPHKVEEERPRTQLMIAEGGGAAVLLGVGITAIVAGVRSRRRSERD